ncbi:uridine kinase-like protein 4 [Rutidosis leptorrhynchoides]|uniref:uridine kinase-like protein 4 n=1 Tax=Rutidosis leptorrhynchoides TaxID=125765 RepID=UPI003A99D269
MGSKPVEYLIEASSGAHFSGFHMDGMQGRNSEAGQATTSVTENVHKQPFIIGVAGGAASGKTTVCDMIIEQLHDQRVVLVNQDSFYHSLTNEELTRVHEYNFDHPDAFENEKLLSVVEMLRQGKAVDIPKYDFRSYKNSISRRSVYSGESMENALRACCKGIKIGKILIHREGDNGQQLIYEKLPQHMSDRHVLLLDPILGTGNSAVQAISLLLKKGVPEANIIFLNLISAPQGVHVVCKRFPRIKIVTSEIETGLNQEYRVLPGMGEFGDRYFGTDDE